MILRPHRRCQAARDRARSVTPLLPVAAGGWRRVALAVIAAAALALVLPLASNAHLAIIRQGGEAGGAIEGGDQLGGSLASGDFNGDGYDDLAMGSPGENVSDLVDAGAVMVNLGSARGIVQYGSFALWATHTGFESQPYAHFGFSVACGDFNHDGYSDLVVGAPDEDVAGKIDAGRVYIFYGGPGGLDTPAIQLDESEAGGTVAAGDQFGYSLATGNFDGDAGGYDDLAVGAPGRDAAAGAVSINLMGGPLGLTTSSASTIRQSDLGSTNLPGSRFGSALAAGNLTGTWEADLAVGAPLRSVGADSAAGTVYVLRGSIAALTTDSVLTFNAGNQDSHQPNARFGAALAVGSFWGSGYQGVAVGEPGRTVNACASAGRVLVVRGGASALDFGGANARVITEAVGPEGVVQVGDLYGSALAAGQFGDPDGYDDLGVGAPGDGLGFTSGAGLFQVIPGGFLGPLGAGVSTFTQSDCDDPSEPGDHFGFAIVFGRFDSSGKGSFAVGAPDEDVEGAYATPDVVFEGAGQVHIVAPWRQVLGLTSKSAVQGTCEGGELFSLRPFDEMPIGGTTRIMTVFLACSRRDEGLDLETPYTIPSWVASEAWVSGSQSLPELAAGETLTLRDLLYMCLRFSANDAALAIADIAEGGGGATDSETFVANVTSFVSEMNAMADSIGMTRTHFANPVGYDHALAWLPTGSDQHSTAWDMWLLGKRAMKDSMFAEIAGLVDYTTLRLGLPCSIPSGFAAGFGSGGIAGLEDSGTDQGSYAAVFSARPPSIYGQPVGCVLSAPSGSARYTESADLMNLSLGLCALPAVEFSGLPFRFTRPDMPTADSSETLIGSLFGASREPVMAFDLYREAGDDSTAVDLEIGRRAEIRMDPGPGVELGIAPFQSHGGFQVSNMDSMPVLLRLTPSDGGGPVVVTVPADSFIDLAPYESPSPLPSFGLTIEKVGGSRPALLSVHEQYGYHLTGIGPASAAPVFSAWLERAACLEDGFWVRLLGRGPSDGSTMFLAVHDTQATVGVEPPPRRESGDLALRLVPPMPNPSRGRVLIRGELGRAAKLALTVYDLQGRVVRRLPERALPFGSFDLPWDGDAADGAPAPAGLYWYRVSLDGRPAGAGRLVLAR